MVSIYILWMRISCSILVYNIVSQPIISFYVFYFINIKSNFNLDMIIYYWLGHDMIRQNGIRDPYSYIAIDVDWKTEKEVSLYKVYPQGHTTPLWIALFAWAFHVQNNKLQRLKKLTRNKFHGEHEREGWTTSSLWFMRIIMDHLQSCGPCEANLGPKTMHWWGQHDMNPKTHYPITIYYIEATCLKP